MHTRKHTLTHTVDFCLIDLFSMFTEGCVMSVEVLPFGIAGVNFLQALYDAQLSVRALYQGV